MKEYKKISTIMKKGSALSTYEELYLS